MQENKTDNGKRKMLTIIVLLAVSLSMIAAINNISRGLEFNNEVSDRKIVERYSIEDISKIKPTGSAITSVGTTVICLNARPIFTYDCNLTDASLNTNDNNQCDFNATDYNNENLTFSVEWLTSPPMFNISADGLVNYTFENQHKLQLNSFRVYVNDTSVCSNNYAYREYNVTVSGDNRAPYLIQDIPDQDLQEDYYAVFNLDDYFDDPDNDELDYFPIVKSGTSITISMMGNRAFIRGEACGNSTMYFVASDPFGLTNISNDLDLRVSCDNQDDSSSGSDGSDSGSGGGNSRSTTCTSDWRCTQWSPCRPENKTYKACVDYRGCDQNNYRVFFEEECTYVNNQKCEERWECSDWGKCENDLRSRQCLDIRNCGTKNSQPLELESCSTIPSCFNGIQDYDETDIDCGGQCGACRNIETPGDIQNSYERIILTSLIAVALTTGLIIYYRAKLLAWYRKVFAKNKKPKRKIYINNAQKEKLLQVLNIIQSRVDDNRSGHAVAEISIFIKEYFKQLLAIETLTKQELLTNVVKLKDKDLEKTLVLFYAKIINFVHSYNIGTDISKEELQSLVDEISYNIYLIAEFTDNDALNSVKDRITTKKDKVSVVFNQLSNIYIALKFGELIVARDYYDALMKEYVELSTKDKYLVYNNIIRSFHAIEYLEKLYKT